LAAFRTPNLPLARQQPPLPAHMRPFCADPIKVGATCTAMGRDTCIVRVGEQWREAIRDEGVGRRGVAWGPGANLFPSTGALWVGLRSGHHNARGRARRSGRHKLGALDAALMWRRAHSGWVHSGRSAGMTVRILAHHSRCQGAHPPDHMGHLHPTRGVREPASAAGTRGGATARCTPDDDGRADLPHTRNPLPWRLQISRSRFS
jgi:hypothetical protein